MSIEVIREIVGRLSRSAGALTALGMALQARQTGASLEPHLRAGLDGVLAAVGVRDAIDTVDLVQLRPVLAGIRADCLLAAKLLSRPSGACGWTHTETEILQAFGDVSAGFPTVLRQVIGPQLDGLLERLEAPTAAFLDVGTGVAALSIAMARQWPSLSVTGIEPWPASLMIARENVCSAGLGARITLRQQPGEALSDVDAFDLAWIASAFIPGPAVPTVVARAAAALRPAGWLLLAMANPGNDTLTTALTQFRTALWGGCLLGADAAQELLKRSGLAAVQTLPGPPHSPISIIAGQKRVHRDV